MTLSLGRVEGRMAVRGAPGTPDGAVTLSARLATAILGVEEGVMRLRAAANDPTISIEPEAADAPVEGRLASEKIEGVYTVPLGPTEAMQPIAMDLSVIGLAPDETLWSRIDAGGTLPREPAEIALTVDGTGRFTKHPGATRPGEALPLELGNLSIERAEIAGLGARAEASGEIEFLQPIAQPTGRIDIRLEGALGLLRALRGAGLIDQETLQLWAVILGTYTRAGEGRDELRAEIAFDMDGIRVNGERLP